MIAWYARVVWKGEPPTCFGQLLRDISIGCCPRRCAAKSSRGTPESGIRRSRFIGGSLVTNMYRNFVSVARRLRGENQVILCAVSAFTGVHGDTPCDIIG